MAYYRSTVNGRTYLILAVSQDAADARAQYLAAHPDQVNER